MFNPARLRFARRRRGHTKESLAKGLGLTARTVFAYERGTQEPTGQKLAELAKLLCFPKAFFENPLDLEEIESSAASFRSMKSMSAAQRDSALAAGAIGFELESWLDRNFELPPLNLFDLRLCKPEEAAAVLRVKWGLGFRPIKNLVHLLESQGVRVFSLAEECRAVDAFSLWRNEKPFIFLNTLKTAERSRFDAAHELGHLVLHRHEGPCKDTRHMNQEVEADQFASAFLMPPESVIAEVPRNSTLPQLIKLKANWDVSLMALVHRLIGLKMISEWHGRALYIEIARNGYRKSEPAPIVRETSQVLQKALQALRQEEKGISDIAMELQVDPQDLKGLMFGLIISSVGGVTHGQKTPSHSARPQLSVAEHTPGRSPQ